MTKKICGCCGKEFNADEKGKLGRKKTYCSMECHDKVTIGKKKEYGAEYRAKKKQEKLQKEKKQKEKEQLHEANGRALANGMSYGQYYAMLYAQQHRHDAKKRR